MRRAAWVLVILASTGLAGLSPPRVFGEEGATLVVLELAYARECNAQLEYLAFAAQAEREGLSAAATLFATAARAESVHARRCAVEIERLGGRLAFLPRSPRVGRTAENLREAVLTEYAERNHLYRRFADHARAECLYDALACFNDAGGAEATHAGLFAAALGEIGAGPTDAPAGPLSWKTPGEPDVAGGSVATSATIPPVPDPTADAAMAPRFYYLCLGDGSIFRHSVKRFCPNCGAGVSQILTVTCPPPPVGPRLTAQAAL